jgi:hypothetical protein
MSIYFTDKLSPGYPSINATTNDDGEVLLSVSNYPLSSMMCIPASAAIQLAEKILAITNNTKEAA